MLIHALREIGVTEVPGGNVHNPRILEYAKAINLDSITTDEVSWCGIFLGYCAKASGFEIPEKPHVARSWLKVGDPVESPMPGDIVVYWRSSRSSWKGHVGLFCSFSEDESQIFTLGGNQKNRVQVSAYSYQRVLGFRRPRLKNIGI